jgi:hypothetical protein
MTELALNRPGPSVVITMSSLILKRADCVAACYTTPQLAVRSSNSSTRRRARTKEQVYNPSRKREELPMSEEALRGLYWAGVIVFALAILVIWARVVAGII